MKIVHTFLPLGGNRIEKKNIYLMTLSMLLAKKHYNQVVLYTDKQTADIVKKIGLPYDEINYELLDGNMTKTFSVPKLIVYAAQKDPFIHIDIDSFIFDKIGFDEFPVIYSAYNEGEDYITADGFVFTGYLKGALELKDILPLELRKQIYFNEIPNMCIFGGFHYELIAEASSYCLNIYEKNKDYFDKDFYNACIIEQLLIPSAMRLITKDNKYYKEIRHRFLYHREIPSVFNFLPDRKFQYPFEVVSRDERILLEDELDLYSQITYNFNGFLHLCGYKHFDQMLYILRSKLLFDFNEGKEYIRKIDEIFEDRYDFEKDEEHYRKMKVALFKKGKSII